MTTEVVSVEPQTSVVEIAKTMLEKRISAVPVLDEDGGLLGIVSEGDLMRRTESGTASAPSWWLALLSLREEEARRFVKTHGREARDVMTSNVVTIDEDRPLDQVAELLESRHIKRVPVIRDGKLVGIVSRADLLRALASSGPMPAPSTDDRSLFDAVRAALEKQTGVDAMFIGATVKDGVVRLWGSVSKEAQKNAARVAAQNVPGVREVDDRIRVLPPNARAIVWP